MPIRERAQIYMTASRTFVEGSAGLDGGRGGSIGGRELSSSKGRGSGSLMVSGILCMQ